MNGIVSVSLFCEVLPKFRNEIPENVCSIRSPTRNFRNFWSNGKRPSFGKVFLINVLQTQRLKSSSFDEHMNFQQPMLKILIVFIT